MAPHRSLSYAENELGVHKVFQECQELVKKLEVVNEARKRWHSDVARYDMQAEDREMDLTISLRGAHSDLSVAALERKVKEAKHQDPELKALRLNRLTASQYVYECDSDIRVLEMQIKVLVARIDQLGGYLNYLAAVKSHEGERK